MILWYEYVILNERHPCSIVCVCVQSVISHPCDGQAIYIHPAPFSTYQLISFRIKSKCVHRNITTESRTHIEEISRFLSLNRNLFFFLSNAIPSHNSEIMKKTEKWISFCVLVMYHNVNTLRIDHVLMRKWAKSPQMESGRMRKRKWKVRKYFANKQQFVEWRNHIKASKVKGTTIFHQNIETIFVFSLWDIGIFWTKARFTATLECHKNDYNHTSHGVTWSRKKETILRIFYNLLKISWLVNFGWHKTWHIPMKRKTNIVLIISLLADSRYWHLDKMEKKIWSWLRLKKCYYFFCWNYNSRKYPLEIVFFRHFFWFLLLLSFEHTPELYIIHGTRRNFFIQKFNGISLNENDVKDNFFLVKFFFLVSKIKLFFLEY